MSWVSITVAILKFAMTIFTWARDQKLIKAGEDKVVASTALAILEETQHGKELRAHVEKLDDPEAALLWDRMLS